MADTYGRGPNGEMLYAPNQYDQWGVYMGNRAELRPQSNVSTGGFNQWTSNLPFEEWLGNYAKQQLARGRGNLGPEVTAAQGTPEYRQQVADREQAAQWIIDRGGTVGDMGIRPAKGAGLNLWNQFADVKGGTYSDRFRQMAKNYYDRAAAAGWQPHEGNAQGGGTTLNTNPGGFGGNTSSGGSFTPGTGGVAPTTPGMAPMNTQTMATPQRTGLVGSNPGFSAPTGPVQPTDSYMQTPRGGKPRGLRGLIGG